MTMTLASCAMPAPLTRSRATMVGVARAMPRRIDQERTGKRSAIAAAEKDRPLARRREHPRNGERGRRFAGAPDGQIADANDGGTGTLAISAKSPLRHSPVNRCQWREQGGSKRALAPPERRLTHGARVV